MSTGASPLGNPPHWLRGAALEEWETYPVDTLDATHRPALIAYCVASEALRLAYEVVCSDGAFAEDGQISGAATLMLRSLALHRQAAAALGATPVRPARSASHDAPLDW